MQYSTQYNQSYSRKIQIDNVVIINTFRKAMTLLSYSFITSRIFMCQLNVCLKYNKKRLLLRCIHHF